MEERVAIVVWKLATNVKYRTLSTLFGLGWSTVGKIVLDTSHAIATDLLSQCVQIPQEENCTEIVEDLRHAGVFYQLQGLLTAHIYL